MPRSSDFIQMIKMGPLGNIEMPVRIDNFERNLLDPRIKPKMDMSPITQFKFTRESTLSQTLEMPIHRLLRFKSKFSKVCLTCLLIPWIILITLHQKTLGSWMKCQPHLANKAKFLFLKFPNLRPPSFKELETEPQHARWFKLLPF